MLFKNKPFLLSVLVLSLGSIPCAMSMSSDEQNNVTNVENVEIDNMFSSSRQGTTTSNMDILEHDNDDIMSEQSNENNRNIYGSQDFFQSINYRQQPGRLNPQPSQIIQREYERKNNSRENIFADDNPPRDDIDQNINMVVKYFEEERFVPDRILKNEYRFVHAVKAFTELYNKAMQDIMSQQNNNNNPINTNEFIVNNNNYTGIKKSAVEEMLTDALQELEEHFDEVKENKSNQPAIHKVLNILQGNKEEAQFSSISSTDFQQQQSNREIVSQNKQCTFALIAYVEAMETPLVMDAIFGMVENMSGDNVSNFNTIKNSINTMQSQGRRLANALNSIDTKVDNISNSISNSTDTNDNLPTWKKWQLGGAGVGVFATLFLVGTGLYFSSGNATKKDTNSPTGDIYEEDLVQN